MAAAMGSSQYLQSQGLKNRARQYSNEKDTETLGNRQQAGADAWCAWHSVHLAITWQTLREVGGHGSVRERRCTGWAGVQASQET